MNRPVLLDASQKSEQISGPERSASERQYLVSCLLWPFYEKGIFWHGY